MTVPGQGSGDPLPAGWRWARLGELSENEKGSFRIGPFGSSLRKDELTAIGVPVIGIENVLPNRFEPSFRRFISAEKYSELRDYTVRYGDVLVTTMGTIGRAAVVPDHLGNAIIDSHLFRMRLDQSQVDPSFVCYAINGYNGLRHHLEAKSSGAIMAGLNTTILRDSPIPLPPFNEQRRIAGVLREQMAAVEKARAAAQAQFEVVKSLPAVLLRQGFPQPGQPLPAAWRWVRLDDVCEVRLGKMLSPASRVGHRAVPYLRNANVQWNRFDLTDVAEMDFSEEQEATLMLRPGDLLVCEGGEPGRAAVWQGQISRCCYQKALHRLRPINTAVDPDFVMYRLWQGAVDSEFTESNAKTTIAHLPAIRLKNLRLAIPPIEEQRRTARVLREQMALALKAHTAAEEELNTINTLPASLLRRAFSGEI